MAIQGRAGRRTLRARSAARGTARAPSAARAAATLPKTMRVAALDAFGPPSALTMREVRVPEVGPSEVLIAVHAAGVG